MAEDLRGVFECSVASGLPDPAGERELGEIADAVFTIPDTHPLLSPMRNLAKSVTVE